MEKRKNPAWAVGYYYRNAEGAVRNAVEYVEAATITAAITHATRAISIRAEAECWIEFAIWDAQTRACLLEVFEG